MFDLRKIYVLKPVSPEKKFLLMYLGELAIFLNREFTALVLKNRYVLILEIKIK